jgi:hypothetical protein
MDREKLEARLIQADKRVVLGEKHIARQKEFVVGLERLGNNSSAARALLEQFEKIQTMQIEYLDAILRESEKLRERRTADRSTQSDK